MAVEAVERRIYTLQEAVGKVLEAEQAGHLADGSSQKDGSWSGPSWKDSVRFMSQGWEAGVARIKAEPLSGIGNMRKPQLANLVVGGVVNPGRYSQGHPVSMAAMVRREAPARVVRIGVDMAVNSGVRAEQIEAVGRNVLLLVEGLRLSGTPAEVWTCITVSKGGKYFDCRIKVQEAGRPVHTALLAYWIANPGVLRRTFFALAESERAEIRDHFGFREIYNYGMPISDYAKADYDEWAPSAQQSETTIKQWVADVLSRRAGQ